MYAWFVFLFGVFIGMCVAAIGLFFATYTIDPSKEVDNSSRV